MRHSAEGPRVRSVISEVHHLNRDSSKKLPVFLTDKVPNAAFLSLKSSDPLTAIIGDQPNSRNCVRIKHLGYVAGKRLSLYGEHFEMVSDPLRKNGAA